mmetsp:Transcript_48683/g.139170  ORF Transcript_48683/g.139170 Transcript_48683/m.139170 type:complete len:584 (+) Transcript_48683:84-1835(+)
MDEVELHRRRDPTSDRPKTSVTEVPELEGGAADDEACRDTCPTLGSTRLERLYWHLTKPVHACTLCMFRVLVGYSLILQKEKILRELSKLQYSAILFSYPGLDFVTLPTPATVDLLVATMQVLGHLIMVGVCTRWACVGYAVIFFWWQHLDQSYTNTHFYFELHLCAALTVVRASDMFSFWHAVHWVLSKAGCFTARLESPTLQLRAQVPHWHLLLMQVLCVIPYAGGCLAKLNANWLLHGGLLPIALPRRIPWHGLGSKPLVQMGMAWTGTVFDGAIGPLLFWRRARYMVAFPTALVFNTINKLVFGLGSFPYIMMASLVLFLEPQTCARVLRLWMPVSRGGTPRPRRAPCLLALLSLYLAMHVALPLRHLAFPSLPEWTEEGHLYAWHMKQRTKRGNVILKALVSRRGAGPSEERDLGPPARTTLIVDPFYDDFTQDSGRLMARPVAFLKYVHHIHHLLKRANWSVHSIHADACISLNTHPPQAFTNTSTDIKDTYSDLRCLFCFRSSVPRVVLPFTPRRECSPAMLRYRKSLQQDQVQDAARERLLRLYQDAGFALRGDGAVMWRGELAAHSWNRVLVSS